MLPSPLLMCVAYTVFDLTGYDWLQMYSRFHGGGVATVCEVYSFRAPIHVVLIVTFIPRFACLWTNGFWLTEDGQLFPSLNV